MAVGLVVVAVLGSVALVRGAERETPNIELKADRCLKAMSSLMACITKHTSTGDGRCIWCSLHQPDRIGTHDDPGGLLVF